MINSPNLTGYDWLVHGFGLRNSVYPANLTTAKQVHSATILDAAGIRGALLKEADAIISGEPGITVAVKTADCVPVLLMDPVTRAVAAVHAGWRGTAQNIVASTVNEFVTRYGSSAEDLHGAIGPCVGACCYEVGPEVARRFRAWNADLGYASSPVRLDLASINEQQLRAAGVRNIWQAQLCTCCRAQDFYSYRRERQQAGRMFSFIGRI